MNEKEYVIISLKHTDFSRCSITFIFWGPDYAGYTDDLEKAGRYSKEELDEKYGGNEHYQFLNEPVIAFLENDIRDSLFVKIQDLPKFGFHKKTLVTF